MDGAKKEIGRRCGLHLWRCGAGLGLKHSRNDGYDDVFGRDKSVPFGMFFCCDPASIIVMMAGKGRNQMVRFYYCYYCCGPRDRIP